MIARSETGTEEVFLAAEVMTGLLLACVYAAELSLGRRKSIFWWVLMVGVPVFAVTRTAIVATVLTLPLSLSPMKLRKRLLLSGIVLGMGVALFFSAPVQAKMFSSGRGTVSDVLEGNVTSSGRFPLWEEFGRRIHEALGFGHGAGAGEQLAIQLTSGQIKYPHNDWLLTLYDYGLLGTLVYAGSLIIAARHALRHARRAPDPYIRVLLFSGASAFIPFALMMITDNIMVYASFFGNLQFLLLGAAYAVLGNVPSGASRRTTEGGSRGPRIPYASSPSY
jgi:O-antigen ligase